MTDYDGLTEGRFLIRTVITMSRFMQEPDARQVEALLIGIAIPRQPKIVLDLTDIFKRPDPEFGETIKLVSSEVALSARMIKLVNPLYI